MPNYGMRSTRELATCHQDLRRLFREIIRTYDCSVICGRRNEEAQNEAFARGFSKVEWPNSKHNAVAPELSIAVDVVPYHANRPKGKRIDWTDTEGFIHFGGYVQGVAGQMGIDIRWGGDWNGNLDLKDQNFMDYPHYQLIILRSPR